MANKNNTKKIIDELSVTALEESTKIAGIAIVSKVGEIIYQTENFNVRNQENVILNELNGESSFTLNNYRYIVTESSSEGIIAENDGGMGYLIITPFHGGVLIAYSLVGANTRENISFLKKYTDRLGTVL
jgi:hypothetical protein